MGDPPVSQRSAGSTPPEMGADRLPSSDSLPNRLGTRAQHLQVLLDDTVTPMTVESGGGPCPLLSVVIPAFNEQECLPALHERLTAVLQAEGWSYEIVLVNDGSSDGTLDIIHQLARDDTHVRWISFSRNFGHEAASTAGLDQARGQAVVLMDADLQDPPELIPEMIARWRDGYHVVYAQRRRREGESWFKRSTAWGFYRLLNSLTQVGVPPDTGDFRLMDRRVIAQFRQLRERHRFVRGMIAWLGFRQTAVQFDRPSRLGGDPKYGPLKLAALSLDAILGFSTVPLRIASALGLLTVAGSAVAGTAVLVHKVVWGIPLPGYALLACGIFFIGGVQMLLLGIAGEYIGRIYTQVQQRPLYVVQEQSGLGAGLESISDTGDRGNRAETAMPQPAAEANAV